MNTTVIGRLLWREYRVQRGFWLSMALMVVAFQAVALLTSVLRNVDLPVTGIYAMALGTAVFYTLGCAATMFATEYEAETYDFQRALPMSATALLSTKLVFALASSLLLFLVAWLMAFAFTRGDLPKPSQHGLIWSATAMAAAELLVWGLFFSLLTTRPLKAAMLAAFAVLVVTFIGIPTVFATEQWRYNFDAYLTHWPVRLVIVLGILGADVWLGLRWLSTRRSSGSWALGLPGTQFVPHSAMARLAWQQLRDSWGVVAVFLLAIPAILALNQTAPGSTGALESIFPWVPLAGILAGACAFLSDQQGRHFRFLVEHGANPRLVWWSRQLVASVLFCLWTACLLLGWVILLEDQTEPHPEAVPAAFIWLIPVVAYAAGQVCSMFFRSGVMAAAMSFILAGVAIAWGAVMEEFDVGLWWSYAPIPLVLLWATWLRAPDWMLERTTSRARLQAAVSLVVPAVILLTAVPFYRVYEVPRVTPDLRISGQRLGPQQRQQRELLEQASQALGIVHRGVGGYVSGWSSHLDDRPSEFTDVDLKWLESNNRAVESSYEAAQGISGPLFTFEDQLAQPERLAQFMSTMVGLLLARGRQLEDAGKLTEASKYYLAALRLSGALRELHSPWSYYAQRYELSVHAHLRYWATLPGQTSALVQEVDQQLQDIYATLPPPETFVEGEYAWQLAFLDADASELGQFVGAQEVQAIYLLKTLAPWEVSRGRRVLDVDTQSSLMEVRDWEAALEENKPLANLRNRRESDPVPKRSLFPIHVNGRWAAEAWATALTQRRATRILLALAAWRLDHNSQLPESLAMLEPDYLEDVPQDPWSGSDFLYFPQGLAYELDWGEGYDAAFQRLPAKSPLLWSAGGDGIWVNSGGGELLDRFDLSVGELRGAGINIPWSSTTQPFMRAPSEQILLEAGLPIPIPE